MEKTSAAAEKQGSERQIRSGYLEVDEVRDPDGIIGIISRRVAGPPIHTIGIFKIFERDGTEEKSSFWNHKQAEAVQRVLAIIVAKARELEATAMADYNASGRGPGRR